MTDQESLFWNDSDIVNYFALKPADPLITKRLEQTTLHTGASALDLGCGGGRHSELLAQFGYETVSVDVNPAMIAHTQHRLARQSLVGHCAMMSISGLGFASGTFDIVVSTGVLHQAKSDAEYNKAISEVSRVLKPGGLFLMNVFTNATWDETYRVPNAHEPNTVLTAEDLWMTLISKESLYARAMNNGLLLEEELGEIVRRENTGPRSVLKAHFIKAITN